MSGLYINYPNIGNSSTGSVSANTIAWGIGALDGQSPVAQGASVSSSTLYMQSATPTWPGVVSSGNQSFAGVKTFTANPQMSGLTSGQTVVTGSGSILSTIAYTSLNTGSTIVSRDSNGNSTFVNVNSTATTIPSTAQTISMNAGSARIQKVIGSSTVQFNLPDATTLISGTTYEFNNNSVGSQITIYLNDGSTNLYNPPQGAYVHAICTDNSTTNGIWDCHSLSPTNVKWGTTGLYSIGTIDGATTGSASANGAVINSTSVYMQSASPVAPGLVNTGTQTIAGSKTFSNTLTTNAIYASSDNVYSLGTMSNASGSRFSYGYFAKGLYVGNYPASANSAYMVLSSNLGIGPNPALMMYSGGSNAYQFGTDGSSVFIADTGASQKLFIVSAHNTRFIDDTTGNDYITGSSTGLTLNNIPLFVAGSGGGSVTKIQGATNGNNNTWTLPSVQGSASWYLKNDGAGNLSWGNYIANNPSAAKSSNYVVGSQDVMVTVAAGCGLITLPDATLVSGQKFRVMKTDYTVNTVSIITQSSQTLSCGSSVSTTLNTGGEMWEFISDGSNYQTTGHSYSQATTVVTSTMSGFGSVTSVVQCVRRMGDSLEVQGVFNTGSVSISGVSGQIGLAYPGAVVVVDTNKIVGSSVSGNGAVGATAGQQFVVLAPSTNQAYVNMGSNIPGKNPLVIADANTFTSASGVTIQYNFSVPIVGWKA